MLAVAYYFVLLFSLPFRTVLQREHTSKIFIVESLSYLRRTAVFGFTITSYAVKKFKNIEKRSLLIIIFTSKVWFPFSVNCAVTNFHH